MLVLVDDRSTSSSHRENVNRTPIHMCGPHDDLASALPSLVEDSSGDACEQCIISISSDDEPEPSAFNELTTQEPIWGYWYAIMPLIADIYTSALNEPMISFQLSSVAKVGSLPDQITHCKTVISSYLNFGYIQHFKVGITFKPIERVRAHGWGYKALGYQHLIVLSMTDNSSFNADLERSLISVYRRYNREGLLVNEAGSYLCANHAPGGESAHHGSAPFFLYFVIKRTR